MALKTGLQSVTAVHFEYSSSRDKNLYLDLIIFHPESRSPILTSTDDTHVSCRLVNVMHDK